MGTRVKFVGTRFVGTWVHVPTSMLNIYYIFKQFSITLTKIYIQRMLNIGGAVRSIYSAIYTIS